MIFILQYVIIYPILFIIDCIDFCLDILFLNSKRNAKFKGCPKPNEIHTVPVDVNDTSISYRSARQKELFRIDDKKINIYDCIFKAAQKFSDRKILGTREILSIEEQSQADGKVLKKLIMKNEYSWITYKEMIAKIDHLANGFLNIGLKSNDNIVIFSETRADWIMCAIACFKIKVPIVTLYSTLGLEALAFGINQTKATYLIASGESVLKLNKILDKVEQLTNVIVITDKFTEKNAEALKAKAKKLNVLTLDQLEKIGKTSEQLKNYERPNKDDLAMIMYTSGSTGIPKGVMKSHGNLLTSTKMYANRLGEFAKESVGIGYLPLAHSLELCTEIGWLQAGIQIGYSSPFTLIDSSTAIKEGHLGDIRILKPNLMMAVPIMLERIKKTVEEKMNKQSGLLKTLFKASYTQKLRKFTARRSSFLLDKIVFSKIKEALGGRMEMIIVGGSILNKDVHEFSQVCFCSVIQAYGLTETCCATAGQFLNDTRTGQVGAAIECSEIKLVDWPEGNYRCIDKPNPRGEILVSGDNITMGYYNMPEKTREDYRVINGVRYFATGDIGEMTPEGNLIIIDRKKDLVKLQGGEYVSLNKVETIVKLMPMVDNCCVIANPSKSYCICLITPNIKKSQEFLNLLSVKNQIDHQTNGNINRINKNGTSGGNSQKGNNDGVEIINELIKAMDRNEKLRNDFNKELLDHCLSQGLDRFEIPAKSKFVKEIWLPDSGLVTDSLKLKRKEIEKFYASEIQILYS